MKTCTKCGETKPRDHFGKHRSTKDGLRHLCRPCNNADARAWEIANPEKKRIQSRRWIAANPERRKAILQKSHDKHREQYAAEKAAAYRADPSIMRERTRRWAKENRDRVNELNRINQKKPARRAYMYAYWNRRRALKMNATPSWLTAIHLAQIQEFYDIAIARSMQTGIQHHVDHIHPLKGENFVGLHVPWNLQVLTNIENIIKGNTLLEIVE